MVDLCLAVKTLQQNVMPLCV